MKCKLCEKDAVGNGLLCGDCDQERMAAASAERLFSGRGLTYGNANRYRQDNWIASVLAEREGPHDRIH